jgi:hypothetical protein
MLPTRTSTFRSASTAVALTAALFLVPGCDDDEGDAGGEENESEVITTVTLTFTPTAGGAPITASFRDADGDGGAPGTADPVALAPETTYELTVSLLNELESPAEDITEEIREEAEEHQFFFVGTNVAGPATGATAGTLVHAYADVESDYGPNAAGDDLPVGLTSTVTTGAAGGTAALEVILRHLPELNGAVQKVPGLAEDLAAGTPLPGDVDVAVTFAVTVG